MSIYKYKPTRPARQAKPVVKGCVKPSRPAIGRSIPYTPSLFKAPPEPNPGYSFVNSNCECWRRQFSNLFCAHCVPIMLAEVAIEADQ
jgi:hypothetical protein